MILQPSTVGFILLNKTPRRGMAPLSLAFSISPKSHLSLPIRSRPSTSSSLFSSFSHLHLPRRSIRLPPSSRKTWKTSAATDALPSDAPQQVIVPAAEDGSGLTVISGLFFLAFVALSILTVGVIYIAVTDFLQKREREKLDKEESDSKKKKGGKKNKMKARSGPRGFGQKFEDDEDY